MKSIVKMIFGSHLYGTSNPDSDQDFKGIFLPSKEQIFLNKIPKSLSIQTKKGSETKNTSNDVDTEIYSLHYFIHLACEGETCALDMLHAPESMLLETSDIWEEIIVNRSKFYTKNLKALIGYARRQASKYGIKGGRLNDAKRVLDFVDNIDSSFANANFKLKEVWENLPIGEHIFKFPPDPNGIRMYQVCGRSIGETASLQYLYNVVDKFYQAYGERAKQASNNENIDWKAVSHALRAAYQVKQILTEGTIIFPLKEASFLKKVKTNQLHYQKEVAPILDDLMEEVEELGNKSTLPEKVDRKFWDDFLIRIIEENI